MMSAADKGTERNQGLVDSLLLLEGQHTSMSKNVKPKINQAVGYTLGGLPPVPPKLAAKIKQGNCINYYPIIGGLWRTNMTQ